MGTAPIDLDGYFPYFLGTIANRWTATSSRLYLEKFGVGVGEWRVLASIRSLGKASAQEVVGLISMDAGAVSRSMAKLEQSGLVRPITGKFVGRTKPYELTLKGVRLHDGIFQIARQREDMLLSNLSPSERDQLLRLMRKVMGRLKDL